MIIGSAVNNSLTGNMSEELSTPSYPSELKKTDSLPTDADDLFETFCAQELPPLLDGETNPPSNIGNNNNPNLFGGLFAPGGSNNVPIASSDVNWGPEGKPPLNDDAAFSGDVSSMTNRKDYSFNKAPMLLPPETNKPTTSVWKVLNMHEEKKADALEKSGKHDGISTEDELALVDTIRHHHGPPPATSTLNTLVKTGCNCKKSKCLKLYCECLARGSMCSGDCNCSHCANNLKHLNQREMAIQLIKERNIQAKLAPGQQPSQVPNPVGVQNPKLFNDFQPKAAGFFMPPEQLLFGNANPLKLKKGCKCKRSNCQKRYCECFAAGKECTDDCICERCKNNERSHSRRSGGQKLMKKVIRKETVH